MTSPLLYANDGYHVNLIHSAVRQREEVYLELTVQGKPQGQPVLLVSAEISNAKGLAYQRRRALLWQAMCRYLNAGGEREGLGLATWELVHALGHFPRLELPEGYALVDSVESTTREDLFGNEQGDMLVVRADEYVERWTAGELNTRLSGVFLPRRDPSEGANEGTQPQLQYRADPEVTPED